MKHDGQLEEIIPQHAQAEHDDELDETPASRGSIEQEDEDEEEEEVTLTSDDDENDIDEDEDED